MPDSFEEGCVGAEPSVVGDGELIEDDGFSSVGVYVHGPKAHFGEGRGEGLDVFVDVLEPLQTHLPSAGVVERVHQYVVITSLLDVV